MGLGLSSARHSSTQHQSQVLPNQPQQLGTDGASKSFARGTARATGLAGEVCRPEEKERWLPSLWTHLSFAEHTGVSLLLPQTALDQLPTPQEGSPPRLLHGEAMDVPLLSPMLLLLLPSPVLGKLGWVLLTESAFFICLSQVGVCSLLGSVPALGAKDTAKKSGRENPAPRQLPQPR